MADWLRPVFARARTPLPPVPTTDRASSFVPQDSNETEEKAPPMPRSKPASRVSSYINLRASTPTNHRVSDSFFAFREPRDPETVYHKPSRDQMAEMVKVVMMNQSSIAPIPVQYNSAILHVLEAYQELREELGKQETVIRELKESHAKDIKDFEELTQTWERRESNYKTELKQLEVQLSKMPDGMEKVSLARTKSTVHGTVKASDTIGRAVATIKEKNSGQIPRHRGQSESTVGGDLARSEATPESIIHPHTVQRKHRRAGLHQSSTVDRIIPTNRNLVNKPSGDNFPMYSSPPEKVDHKRNKPDKDLALPKTAQLDALEQERVEQALDQSFDSSISRSSFFYWPRDRVDSDADNARTQIESLPAYAYESMFNTTRHTVYEGAIFDTDSKKLTTPTQMSFSFNPGDDTDLDVLAAEKSDILCMAPRAAEVAQPPLVLSNPKSRPSTSLSPLHVLKGLKDEEQGFLHRDDSTSSVTTAIRHNSAKSTPGTNTKRNSSLGRVSGSGSNEAIAAAVRAIAGSGTGSASKIPRRSSSNGGSGEGSLRGASSRGSIEVIGDVRKGSPCVKAGSRSGSREFKKKRESLGGSESAWPSNVSLPEGKEI